MKLTLKKLTKYRVQMIGHRGDPIAIFHIDDLWDNNDPELNKVLNAADIGREFTIVMQMENTQWK